MELADEFMWMILLGIGIILPIGSFIIFFIADFISFLKNGYFKTRE